MIDYIHKDLYWKDSIDKQLKIELEDGTILDNSMIYSEEFELEESLCSDDELRFGACEASCVKFRIFSIPNRLVGQKITIGEVLGGQTDSPMQIGKYKIASAKPTADRDFIDTVAYDSMYDIIHSDVAAWYNNQFKATTSTTTDEDGNETTVVTYSTTTLKKFRDSFFLHFGIDQVDVTLPNDGMVVSKTIEIVPNEDGTIGETLSGSTVIEAICELNGCFGHINRDGKFEYVTLKQISKELFPADDLFPRNDLYPASDNTGVVIYNWQYEATEYEDFDVQPITQVQIIQEDNDIGMMVGTDGNKYVVNSNFLTYSLSDEELETVGTNLLSVIEKAKYTPIKANVIGNPCVTVGDIIKIVTNSAILYSYVINRTLKGCQSLTDEFESNGEEYRSVDVNSTIGQIKKLQGRSNVLERSIDETRSTIANVEKGLKSEIKQTAESITSEVERATSEEQKLSSKIEQTAESITSTVAKSTKQWDTTNVPISEYGFGFGGTLSGGDSYIYSDVIGEGGIYLDQKTGYGWKCKGTSTLNGKRIALFGYRPSYTFSRITDNLSSEIKQTAESIAISVSEDGDIITSLTTDKNGVSFVGNKFVVDAKNFTLDEGGNATLSGVVKSSNAYSEATLSNSRLDFESLIGTGGGTILIGAVGVEDTKVKYGFGVASDDGIYIGTEDSGNFDWVYLVNTSADDVNMTTSTDEWGTTNAMHLFKGDAFFRDQVYVYDTLKLFEGIEFYTYENLSKGKMSVKPDGAVQIEDELYVLDSIYAQKLYIGDGEIILNDGKVRSDSLFVQYNAEIRGDAEIQGGLDTYGEIRARSGLRFGLGGNLFSFYWDGSNIHVVVDESADLTLATK